MSGQYTVNHAGLAIERLHALLLLIAEATLAGAHTSDLLERAAFAVESGTESDLIQEITARVLLAQN